MTWTKLSDDYADECWTLSDAAFRLYTEALIWSNRKLLDCRIPFDDLPRLSKAAHAADELTGCGWWTRDDENRVFVLRYHAVYQPTREQVVAIQERNRRNGAKGGRPRKPGRENPPTTQVETQMETHLETHGDGTGRDGIPHLSATQVERTTQLEEEQDAHTHTREDCAADGCTRSPRHGCWTCVEHAREEFALRRAAS